MKDYKKFEKFGQEEYDQLLIGKEWQDLVRLGLRGECLRSEKTAEVPALFYQVIEENGEQVQKVYALEMDLIEFALKLS